MKKTITIIVSLMFLFSVAGFCLAAEKVTGQKEVKAQTAMEEKSVEKQVPVKIKHIAGEVTAIDAMAGTLKVKNKKQELSLSTDNKTIIRMGKEKKTLADLKAGNKVIVKYEDVKGVNLAKSIAIKQILTAKAPIAPGTKKVTR
jgi:hypothetical protein